MIAADLCVMGGCYAQDSSSRCVDTYWPSLSIEIAYRSPSVGLIERDYVDIGANPDEFRVHTKQYVKSGIASFFYVFQNEASAYNCPLTLNGLQLNSNTDPDVWVTAKDSALPMMVELVIDSMAARYISHDISCAKCTWNPVQNGHTMRIVDARAGVKDFFFSYGMWDREWFVLPMRSATAPGALFEFEDKILVEL